MHRRTPSEVLRAPVGLPSIVRADATPLCVKNRVQLKNVDVELSTVEAIPIWPQTMHDPRTPEVRT